MKKIINGRSYNTETATRIGEYEPHPYQSDFSYYCETLYQKKTGEFFLHGTGNAASKYSKSCGQNEWCGSEQIIPLNYTAAQKWAEEKLDTDDYIKCFGEPDETGEKITLGIQIDKAAAQKLANLAAKTGKTKSEILTELIVKEMES